MTAAVARNDRRVQSSRRVRWLKEIRRLQSTVELLIARQPFQRLLKEISNDYKLDRKHFRFLALSLVMFGYRSVAIPCCRSHASCGRGLPRSTVRRREPLLHTCKESYIDDQRYAAGTQNSRRLCIVQITIHIHFKLFI